MMLYSSTRSKNRKIHSGEAIYTGISPEGGLFVPQLFPKFELHEITEMSDFSYEEIAYSVLSVLLTDYSETELKNCIHKAYQIGQFDSPQIAPLKAIDKNTFILELWHGPTCAFKDMALQLLPHLLTVGAKKYGNEKKIVILVATSGDTGKAALEGFKDVDGTEIIVFYPEDGVSNMQKLQMETQRGNNVHVCAVKGNFDDAQNGVKEIFTDKSLLDDLDKKNIVLSSANSINWGRLAPQIVYYFSAYVQMLKSGTINEGDPVNFSVPTGNFGNILAAYYAKKMGLPIGKLVCASNSNHVLYDFIQSGVYNRNRSLDLTISPSMDILISSNLERLLYDLSDQDNDYISACFDRLKNEGIFEIGEKLLSKVQNFFFGAWCDDSETVETLSSFYKKHNYVCDTHSAVAVFAAQQYRKTTNDHTPMIIASTANPYKFPQSVLQAVKKSNSNSVDDFSALEQISSISGTEIPTQIKELKSLQILHRDNCKKDAMKEYVYKILI